MRDSLQHPRPSPSWLMRLSRKRLNRSQSCNYNEAPSGSHSLSPLSRTLRANIIQRLSCREWTGPIFIFTPSLRTHCGECSWAARCSQRRVPLQSDQRKPQHQAPSMTSSRFVANRLVQHIPHLRGRLSRCSKLHRVFTAKKKLSRCLADCISAMARPGTRGAGDRVHVGE